MFWGAFILQMEKLVLLPVFDWELELCINGVYYLQKKITLTIHILNVGGLRAKIQLK